MINHPMSETEQNAFIAAVDGFNKSMKAVAERMKMTDFTVNYRWICKNSPIEQLTDEIRLSFGLPVCHWESHEKPEDGKCPMCGSEIRVIKYFT